MQLVFLKDPKDISSYYVDFISIMVHVKILFMVRSTVGTLSYQANLSKWLRRGLNWEGLKDFYILGEMKTFLKEISSFSEREGTIILCIM